MVRSLNYRQTYQGDCCCGLLRISLGSGKIIGGGVDEPIGNGRGGRQLMRNASNDS